MKQNKVAAAAALMVVCLFSGIGSAGAQSLPVPWMATDVGSPATVGSTVFTNGAFHSDSASDGMGYKRDEHHFLYQTIAGDVDLRARVDAISSATSGAKAGVIIRSSLAEDAAFATAMTSASSGFHFQRRQKAGGGSAASQKSGNAPRWVRLTRVGSRVTAFVSADGSNWTTVGSDNLSLGATAYIGIAVTSTDVSNVATASVSNVSINGSSVTPPTTPPTTPPPTGALPAGQASADVGSPAIAGSASFSSGRYTINGNGVDIWGNADEFHYVYQPVDGDVDVIARVVSISNVDPSAKAGVMIRESLTAGSSHAAALLSAQAGYAVLSRPDTGASSQKINGGSGLPAGWVRLVRKGTTFTAYRSADGSNWKSMGSTTVQMNTTAFVGIAVASDTAAAAATAVVEGLKIVESTVPSNKAPTVILSAPANGGSYTAPATVTLTASAADSDGTVSSVEFYANGTLVGKDTSAPFTVVGTLQQGTYAITAVAYDNAGASTVSGAVNVTVTGTTQPTPTPAPTGVAFTASTTHSSVSQYVLEIHKAGQTPGSTAATATSNLGKPAPNSAGDIVVDVASFFQALPAGNYIATVVAKNSSSSARSSAVAFTR